MSLSSGDTAPPFKLVSSDTSIINLSDYSDRNVLLLFFPLAFTSVCTAELCSTRDNIEMYNSLDADVLAISVDSPFTLAKFKQDNNLNFPLLSDFNKTTSSDYHSLYDDFVLGMKGVSKRSAFVVNRKGEIAYAEVLDNAGEQPNFDLIKQTLEDLKQ